MILSLHNDDLRRGWNRHELSHPSAVDIGKFNHAILRLNGIGMRDEADALRTARVRDYLVLDAVRDDATSILTNFVDREFPNVKFACGFRQRHFGQWFSVTILVAPVGNDADI